MTQKTSTMAAVAVAGLITVLAPAFAQNQGSTNAQGQAQGQGQGTMQQDHKFAMDAAQGGLMEVELGQLAAQKASNQGVKDFGQRMVRDHGQANQQLMQIASQKGMSLPKELTTDKKQHREKLAAASGAEFDRMYMSHMVKDHEKDVKEFEKQAQSGKDPALRSFAEQTLPILRQHLELARSLASLVGADHGSHGSHN
jgi:putative membrane protein